MLINDEDEDYDEEEEEDEDEVKSQLTMVFPGSSLPAVQLVILVVQVPHWVQLQTQMTHGLQPRRRVRPRQV